MINYARVVNEYWLEGLLDTLDEKMSNIYNALEEIDDISKIEKILDEVSQVQAIIDEARG